MAQRVFWDVTCEGESGCCCRCPHWCSDDGDGQWCVDLSKSIDSCVPDKDCRMPLRDDTRDIIGIEILYSSPPDDTIQGE